MNIQSTNQDVFRTDWDYNLTKTMASENTGKRKYHFNEIYQNK